MGGVGENSQKPVRAETAPPTAGASPNLQLEILARKIELTYSHLPTGLVVNVSVAIGLALFLSSVHPWRIVGLWALGVTAVTALRFADLLGYRRRTGNLAHAERWRRNLLAGAAGQGLMWGVAGFFLFPVHSPVDQLFLVAALSAMAGGAVIFLSPIWSVYILYMIPTVIPVSLRLIQGDLFGQQITGALGLVYGAAMAQASYRTSRWVDDHARTSLEKEALTTHLKSANADLEQYRAHLEKLVAERTRALSQANVHLQKEIREKDAEKMKAELNEARFRELAELLPEVIYEMDAEGRLTFLNRQSNVLTGCESDGLPRGLTLADFFVPGDQPRVEADVRLMLAGETAGPHEYTALRADKTTFPVMTVSAQIVHDGKVCGLRGILIDTSQIKELELKIRHTSKMEAIGTLAGGVAHDFNNILSAVLGFAELAAMKAEKGSKQAGYLDQIIRAVDRAKGLVSQILTFSRKNDEERGVFAVVPVVEESLRFIAASIPATIRLVTDFRPACGAIEADETQFHQVVVNLCTNAYQAMKEKGGELRVSLRPVEVLPASSLAGLGLAPGAYVELAVADTGPGIDEAIRLRIFDPFFTTKGVGEGTGMGLAVVHGIVQSCGGIIVVESQPGEGSVFRVYLKRHEGAADTLSPASAEIQGGSERVLFVDDEPAIVEVVCMALNSFGYAVTSTQSAPEALAILRDSPEGFDILVTDLSMPFMTGMELIRQVRLFRPDIPAVICTGNDESLSPALLDEAKVTAVLNKPIRTADLALAIRSALGREGHPSSQIPPTNPVDRGKG